MIIGCTVRVVETKPLGEVVDGADTTNVIVLEYVLKVVFGGMATTVALYFNGPYASIFEVISFTVGSW